MKKLVVLIITSLFLFSCGGTQKTVKKEETKQVKEKKVEKKVEKVVVSNYDDTDLKEKFKDIMSEYHSNEDEENYSSYIEKLTNLTNDYKRYPAVGYNIATFYMEEKNYEKAYKYLYKTLKAKIYVPALTNLSYVSYKLNKSEKVLKAFKKLFDQKFDMKSIDEDIRNEKELALSNYALLVILSGHPEDSIKYIRKILTVKPKSVYAYQTLTYAYIQMKKWSIAKKVVDLAISYSDKKETKANLYVIKGWIYEGEGRSSEMVASYKKAMELDPVNVNAVLSISTLLMKYGAGSEAKPYLKILLGKYKDNVLFRNLYAVSLRMSKNYDEAIEQYDQIIASEPKFKNAYYNKAFLLQKYKENPKDAIVLFQKYRSLGGKVDVTQQIKTAKQMVKDIEEMRREEAAEKAEEEKNKNKKK